MESTYDLLHHLYYRMLEQIFSVVVQYGRKRMIEIKLEKHPKILGFHHEYTLCIHSGWWCWTSEMIDKCEANVDCNVISPYTYVSRSRMLLFFIHRQKLVESSRGKKMCCRKWRRKPTEKEGKNAQHEQLVIHKQDKLLCSPYIWCFFSEHCLSFYL